MASAVMRSRVGICLRSRSRVPLDYLRCLAASGGPTSRGVASRGVTSGREHPLPGTRKEQDALPHTLKIGGGGRGLLLATSSCLRTVERCNGTLSSSDTILDEITSASDAREVLNLTRLHRSRLNHLHVYQALNHLWTLGKYYDGEAMAEFLAMVQGSADFQALCVLAENKLDGVDGQLMVDTLYSTLRLVPETSHPLVRELRTAIHKRVDELGPESLSKLAVCLHDMGDNRSPLFGTVLRLFSAQLHEVDSIRPFSAWLREVIHLVPESKRAALYQKAAQLLANAQPQEIGDNSIRRVIHAMVRVRCPSQPLLNQCAQLLIQMTDQTQLRELCILQSLLSSLDYENKALREALTSSIIQKIPDCQDPDEVALAMESIGDSASANLKLLLTDKAEGVVHRLRPNDIGHMCAGLRTMGFRTQTPLVRKLLRRIEDEHRNLSLDNISNILGFLNRLDDAEPEVFGLLLDRLLTMLPVAFSPGRVLGIVSTLALLPDVQGLAHAVPERIRDMMPQLHIAGINQMLLACCRIARKLDRTSGLCGQFSEIRRELFDRAQASIHKITSIYYLNNIVEIVLQDGGHVLVLDAAMQEYSNILHRLSPQLAVDCARNLFRSRYLQRELMDTIAAVTTRHINKITPMQILYILSPFCTLNYLPANSQAFLQACVDRCLPFLDSLPAGYLVDLTHLLTFVQKFPEPFIRHIFSLDFLTRLDEELETIPNRSMMYRRKLMYLNRTVALECPELQVPWFHEQFSQDLLKKRSLTFDPSLMSIQSTLVDVLGGPQYLRSFVVSPYYYEISFECVLDGDGNPLPCADYGSVLNRSGDKVVGSMLADLMQWGTQTKQLPAGAQRVAIDFLPSSYFCINSRHCLGILALKRRHMELMGYKYVQIPHFEWSSQALAEPEEKAEYLRQLVFGQAEDGVESTAEAAVEMGGLVRAGRIRPKLPPNLGVKKEGLLEDEAVLRVLHTLDKIG